MRGFTLIELLVTFTILGIITAVGIPSLSGFLDNRQSNNSVSQMRQVLNSARAIALSKTQKTKVCPNINGVCNSNWQNPITIFNDSNSNGAIDNGETVYLTASNESSHGLWLTRNNAMSSIEFNEQGHAFGSATTLLYCPTSKNNQFARQLVINFQGRIRSDYYLSNRGTPYASLGRFNCPP